VFEKGAGELTKIGVNGLARELREHENEFCKRRRRTGVLHRGRAPTKFVRASGASMFQFGKEASALLAKDRQVGTRMTAYQSARCN